MWVQSVGFQPHWEAEQRNKVEQAYTLGVTLNGVEGCNDVGCHELSSVQTENGKRVNGIRSRSNSSSCE